jgi:hypothetical protein
VFWLPNACPLQNGPAYSVTAVAANHPLSVTAITAAATMAASAIGESRCSLSASRIMARPVSPARIRIGRIRELTRSDHRPTRMRASAPSNCEVITSAPAEPVTNRPVAVLQLAAAMPPRNRNAPTATSGCTEAAA